MMPPRSSYFHPGPAADYWETREMDALNKYLEATQDHLGVGGCQRQPKTDPFTSFFAN